MSVVKMSLSNLKSLRLSERDLDFLVETASPEVTDKPKLKQIIREDEDFRNTFIRDEKVFRRLMDDEEIFLIDIDKNSLFVGRSIGKLSLCVKHKTPA